MSVFKYHAFIYFMRPPPWYGTRAIEFFLQKKNILLLINLAQHRTPPPPTWGRGSKHVIVTGIYCTAIGNTRHLLIVWIIRWLLPVLYKDDYCIFLYTNTLFCSCQFFHLYIHCTRMSIYLLGGGGGAYICTCLSHRVRVRALGFRGRP